MATADDDPPFSVEDAVRTIDRATAFAEPVRRRSEGVTIALWGLITACVILTSAVADDIYGAFHAGFWGRVVSSTLWIPWALIGVLGTLAIWRVAEVSSGQPVPGRRRSPGAILGVFAILCATVILVVMMPIAAAGLAVSFIGILWLAVGALDIYKATPAGRTTLVGVGGTLIVAGAIYGALTFDSMTLAWRHFEAFGTLTAGLIPIAAGLRQALRR